MKEMIKYERMIIMFNNIYGILARIGALTAAIAKAYDLWISSADPIVTAIKILGICIIIWFLFTPIDLLQNED